MALEYISDEPITICFLDTDYVTTYFSSKQVH